MTAQLAPMVRAGLVVATCSDIPFLLENLPDDGFDFAIVPIVHPKLNLCHIDVERLKDFFIPNLILQKVAGICYDWPKHLVCKIECSMKNLESNDSKVQERSKDILIQQISHSLYLGFTYVLLTLDQPNFINFAREIYAFAVKKIDVIFYLKVPSDVSNSNIFKQNTEDQSKENTWEWWNTFRTIASLDNIQLALEVAEDMDKKQLYRWLGEPVRSIFISTHMFKTNKAGFPFLDRTLRAFVLEAINKNVNIVIKGACRHLKYITYVQYIQYLKQSLYNSEFQNVSNHLSSDLKNRNNIYEDHKWDKYIKYHIALHKALIDKVSDEKAQSVITTICIIGEGTKRLMTLAIAAAKEAKRKIKVIVIDAKKQTLNMRYGMEDADKSHVTVVLGDMKSLNTSIKVDIMVLGFSDIFADTVLSPEFLFSVQHYVKDDGICIPHVYTSYLVPITSQTLHDKVRRLETDPELCRALFEQPHRVYEQKMLEISTPQKLFTFSYPCKKTDIVSCFHKKLEFPVEQSCAVHGLVSFFDMCLYKDVTLSIRSNGLTSEATHWFPIYFPIKTPLQLKRSSKMEIHVWRKHDGEKIWYEWLISRPVSSHIHNTNGSSHSINVGENNALFSLYKRNYMDLISH